MSPKVGLLIVAVLVFAASVYYILDKNSLLSSPEKVVPLSRSWEKAVPHQAVPQGLSSLSAESCGACHQNHYQEWKLSTHAHAWTDLQFQSELKKESSPFLCINCHIPLQNQQEFLIKGLINGDIYKPVKEKNPYFDKALQQEGINCATCHVRNGAIIGTNGQLNAPHKVKKDPEFLSEKLCISCHNANAVVTPTLACSFETGDEWQKGPYFGKKNCISCHMPPQNRALVVGFPQRKSHTHFFSGSGIPKFDTLSTTVLNGLTFSTSALKSKYLATESPTFKIKLKNENAGHRVPSGDPERFILTEFELLETSSQKVIKKQTERIGEKWQWYPTAKKLEDNNLYPGEERTYSFQIPKQLAAGNYELGVKVSKHRMDAKTATYNKLGKNYPLFITIYKKSMSFSVK